MTVEMIEMTDGARLRVEHDEDATCPRDDWHMITGFYKIDGAGDSRLKDVPAVHEWPELVEAHNRFCAVERRTYGLDGIYRYRYPLIGMESEVLARWARIFHGVIIDYDAEHGGFWFCAGADYATAQTPQDASSRALFFDNWPDLPVGSPEHESKQREVIAQEQGTYRQWADGEVYTVILERAALWQRIDSTGTPTRQVEPGEMTTWEQAESIGGCYLGSEYAAREVALEHFDLEDAEREALA